MMRSLVFGLTAATLALSGCSAESDDPNEMVDGTGSVGGSGTGGSGATGGTGGDHCEEEGSCAERLCEESVPGRPMLRRLTVREFSNLIDHTFPEIVGDWDSGLSQDPVSVLGFDNQANLLTVTKQVARELDNTAASIGSAVQMELPALLPCSTSSADRACAGEFLSKYGRRLFRRPLSAEETDKYLGFFDTALSKTDFPAAVSWMTRALVHATPTLYRHELGVPNGDVRELTQYEIATELAFTFTGEPPSDALLDLAASGSLSSPEALLEQATQLVNSAAGREHLHRFFEATLEYSRVGTITKNTNGVDFNSLRDQMREETRHFIEAVVMDRGGTVADLLTAPISFPSQALSSHYGWPAPPSDYSEVQRPAGAGIGVLAQGSILATEASPDSSSPTQRGLLVLEKILCEEPPTVPPSVPEVPDPQAGVVTTRERYEMLHAGEGACRNCHLAFDPIGFGFEHFDEVGRYREDEFGLMIDSSGTVPGMSPEVAFAGLEELATGLAARPEVGQCLSSHLKTYVFATTELCLGEAERTQFSDSSVGFSDYLISLAAEPHFRIRQN